MIQGTIMKLSDWQFAEIQLLLTAEELIEAGEWRAIELEPLHYYSCCENLNIAIHHSYIDIRGQHRKAKRMTLRPDFDGYLICSFKNKAIRFHRLKAQIFLSDYDESLEVNHKDGDKQNNAIYNLEMTTHKDNIIHFYNDPKVDHLKQQRIQRQKEFMKTDKGKMQQAQRIARFGTTECRAKRSAAMKSYYANPENRDKTADAMKQVCESIEKRQQMSIIMKLKWQNQEFRDKMIASRAKLPKEVRV